MKMRKTRFNDLDLDPSTLANSSWPDVELESDTHAGQLNIKELEHTRDRDHGNVFAARVSQTLCIHPQIGLAAVVVGQHGTPPAADRNVLAAPVLFAAVLVDGRSCAEERAAGTADGCFGVIGAVHQAVLKKEGCAVGK